MAMHSRIYLTAKRNYKAGLWSKERLRALVEAGTLYEWEYEEITGEPYAPTGD
jgi:hypothetical protein